MKKPFLMAAILCATVFFAACGDKEPQESDTSKVTASHISFTECKSHTDKTAKANPAWGDPDSVSVDYADGTAFITHYNLLVNCGFFQSGILVDISVDGSTITINEHENPDGPQADCMCTTDNSFHIDNIPPGTYTLVFTNWYPEPYSMAVTF